ncbi:hypothetical protein BQ8794_240053 [Mesorhizobium prunaredense]|uniref:Uncharacterized protein n=2 Tax=Mesorhizobium TaxID=68287 RepID=A0A1R3V7G2_9HYPH|nr:conserved hypothetical protein [Mesorhizobium ventifaucium]SIT55846.1 hypothetical protein BQ8794_240053 [Mesorhizobium prunaredense]
MRRAIERLPIICGEGTFPHDLIFASDISVERVQELLHDGV